MAKLDFDFNASEIEDRPGFETYPVGDYIAEVTASDYRDTKAGTGKYIYLEFTILDGEFAGRKYFERLNVQNENKIAMDIANSNLKDLLTACGIHGKPFNDTMSLHNKPVMLKIGVDKKGGNTVRFKPAKGGATARPTAPAKRGIAAQAEDEAAPTTTTTTAAPKKKPWEK